MKQAIFILFCLILTSCAVKHLDITKTETKKDSTVNTSIADYTHTRTQEWADYTAWTDADTVQSEIETDSAGHAWIETDDQLIDVTQLTGNRRLKVKAIAKAKPVIVKINKVTETNEATKTAIKSHVIEAVKVNTRVKDKKPDVFGNASALIIVLIVLALLFWVYKKFRKQY